MGKKGISTVLITGGAGFIGSHTAHLLVEKGYSVRIIDSLEPQVHGGGRKWPIYLKKDSLELILGDVGDRKLLSNAISGADAIFHLASRVGVGQSMYQVARYIDGNTGTTATLLDLLINQKHNVKKLVVASSMSIYGEGRYFCEKCGLDQYPEIRGETQLKARSWDHRCGRCSSPLKDLPTSEEKPLASTSIYAMSKRHQEEMCLLIGKTYRLPTVALRYFNVYGSRQALSNPYTGACAIFTSRILGRKPPYIFEDGHQKRDFVHVKDIARANLAALEHTNADYEAINVGSGRAISILELAKSLLTTHGSDAKPVIANQFRAGDIRHCYADIEKAKKLLNYHPQVELQEGLAELSEWAKAEGWGAVDLFDKALGELKKRHLTI